MFVANMIWFVGAVDELIGKFPCYVSQKQLQSKAKKIREELQYSAPVSGELMRMLLKSSEEWNAETVRLVDQCMPNVKDVRFQILADRFSRTVSMVQSLPVPCLISLNKTKNVQ